ncbi:LLM class flavin-dependent oxidoreductase [Candidatus Entotheonella serta]|nr:LLM class flavin-dependent oxidoreductase [Candidatus Entotheonella serta]
MSHSFRLGFLTHLRGSDDPRRIYSEALKLFEVAAALGFDSGWVAQHHFTKSAGYLPSPLPFLAAVAERTQRIRLGTSIVVLPLETPLRVAEDAAVVDLLSDGRLELGVGSGASPLEFLPFDVDIATRHERTTEGLELIKRALRGEVWGDAGQQLQPPAPTLTERIWLSGLSPIGATYAASHEAGLLLSRAAWGYEEPTDQVQLPVAQTYREAWGDQVASPRIGLSRGFYIAADKSAALREMQADLTPAIGGMVKQGRMAPGLSLETYCERFHIAYGHPEEVTASLQADQVFSHATELILQLDPIFPTLEQTIRMFEQVATQIAPALGWVCATDTAKSSSRL